MTEIHHTGDSSGSAMTAIVAILVIAIIAIALWFGFRGTTPSIPNTGDVNNIEFNAPVDAGGALDPGVSGGAAN